MDNSGDLVYWWQQANTTAWNKQIVATALNGQEPAIAWTGNSVVIAAVDLSQNLDYWWQQAGTTQWNKQLVAQNVSNTPVGFGQPAIGWTGSSVVITASDGSGNLWYWWQQAGTTQWHQESVATGGGPQSAFEPVAGARFKNPAIAWTGSTVVIAAPESAGDLRYWWQPADTTPWNEEMVVDYTSGTAMKGIEAPAIAWTGSSVVIAASDGVGNLWYWWQPAGAPKWSNPECVSQYSDAWQSAPWTGEPPVGPPAIAWTGSSVAITAIDGAGNLVYWWQKAGTTPWNRETVASNLRQDFPPGIAWTGSSIVIAAVDTSCNLVYWWQKAGTTQWNKETVANL